MPLGLNELDDSKVRIKTQIESTKKALLKPLNPSAKAVLEKKLITLNVKFKEVEKAMLAKKTIDVYNKHLKCKKITLPRWERDFYKKECVRLKKLVDKRSWN